MLAKASKKENKEKKKYILPFCVCIEKFIVVRIGVNTRLLLKDRLEGIGYFTFQILKRITTWHKDIEFYFFFDRPYDADFVFSSNVKPIVLPLQSRHPVLWKIYFDFLLPIYCKKYKIDLFFSPENYLPKVDIPTICTVHDLNFMHNDAFIGNAMHQKYYLKYFPKNAIKASSIATVSEYSKQDIIKTLGIEEEKITVVYSAANACFDSCTNVDIQAIKQKYTQGEDYFYFVGAISKRKNLEGIFSAFDIFKQENLNNKTKLVIIGNKKWWKGDIEQAYNIMKHKDEVVFTGRISSEEISKIAQGSIGLVFPSFFEGFGVPIIEAFQNNTAVITSNNTSLIEIASDAALLIDPYNNNAIAKAMTTLYNNPSLRQELIEKGKQRAKFFTWDKTAQRIWSIIEKYKQ
ncbi:MAG: glycosyltransferase family 1 protein [Bacteroidota bacterium]|nr:glycosyltransferase family 1 protein [Bacteroidota bacterium]